YDGEPFIAEHYGEDMLYFSLPAEVYKLVQQAAAAFVSGSTTTIDKKELKRRSLARYRGVSVESVVLEDEEEYPDTACKKCGRVPVACKCREDEEENYQAEWLAGLSDEEREKYDGAPCLCGHTREWHEEDDYTGEYNGECSALNCGKTYPAPRCKGYHCRE